MNWNQSNIFPMEVQKLYFNQLKINKMLLYLLSNILHFYDRPLNLDIFYLGISHGNFEAIYYFSLCDRDFRIAHLHKMIVSIFLDVQLRGKTRFFEAKVNRKGSTKSIVGQLNTQPYESLSI